MLSRPRIVPLSSADVEAVLDYICAVGQPHQVFYLWRPYLRDPGDDMVLELAVAAECDAILTHNIRDFSGADRFGLDVLHPADFLRSIGERPPAEQP